MSQKLQQFISKVRGCKTAAEEAAVVAKECAAIRSALKDESHSYRHRNVAKLMFIDLLGYPVSFGQMDCLKLLASNYFFEKRIGYLAIPVLMDQYVEILMLTTNSIKNDLTSGSQYVASAALTCLANTGTPDMVETLNNEIVQFSNSSNPTLRKKSLITCSKIVRNQPHQALIFSRNLETYLAERNHGSVISCLALEETVVKTFVAHSSVPNEVFLNVFNTLPSLLKIEHELILASSALAGSSQLTRAASGHNQYGIRHGTLTMAEFDYQGLCDPFLQCKLLKVVNRIVKTLTDERAHPSAQSTTALALPSRSILDDDDKSPSNDSSFANVSNPFETKTAPTGPPAGAPLVSREDARSVMADVAELLAQLLMTNENYKNSALSIVIEALQLAITLLMYEMNSVPTRLLTPRQDRRDSLEDFLGADDSPKATDPEPRRGVDCPADVAPWFVALHNSTFTWIKQLIKHKDPTVQSAGLRLGLKLPKQLIVPDQIIPLLFDVINTEAPGTADRGSTESATVIGPDKSVQTKAVCVLHHVADKDTAVVITDRLLEFLLLIADPTPLSPNAATPPPGKDVQVSGRTAVVVNDVTSTTASRNVIKSINDRLLNTVIDCIEDLINTHPPSKEWEINSSIKLCRLVGNHLTVHSRMKITNTLLGAPRALHLDIAKRLLSSLRDDFYNAHLVSVTVAFLAMSASGEAVAERPKSGLADLMDSPPPAPVTQTSTGDALDDVVEGTAECAVSHAVQRLQDAVGRLLKEQSAMPADAVVALIKELMALYGFCASPSRQQSQIVANAPAALGAFSRVGASTIVAPPSAREHVFATSLGDRLPCVVMPRATAAAAAGRAALLVTLIGGLGKLGRSAAAAALLRELLAQTVDVYARDFALETLAALGGPAAAIGGPPPASRPAPAAQLGLLDDF